MGININLLTFSNKYKMATKKKRNQHKKKEWSEINNIILKQIKEYPKVICHREKWFWINNGI